MSANVSVANMSRAVNGLTLQKKERVVVCVLFAFSV